MAFDVLINELEKMVSSVMRNPTNTTKLFTVLKMKVDLRNV